MKTVTLSEVATFNPRLDTPLQDRDTVSFLPMAAVSEQGSITYEDERAYAEVRRGYTFFQRGDCLLAKITPCFENGKCALTDDLTNEIGFGSTEFHVVRPNESLLDRKYLFYLLWNKTFRLIAAKRMQGAAGQKRVTADFLKQHRIPLPPLEEQKRIAAILDKADAIRKKRQQAIELADQFLRSVFLDMFGDPVTNPKGWEEVELSSLLKSKLQNGAYYPADQYSEAGTEMVHMSDAFYDVIQRGNLKRVNASSDDLLKYQLTSEDLLISRRSLTYDGAAKPCLIPDNEEPLIFESSMIRVTPNRDRILPKFLFHYLSDESVKRHRVRKYVTGATIKGISQKNLEIIGVLVPPLELQRRFTDFVTQFDSQIKTHESHALRLDELFASINRQAFNGKRDGIRGADRDL